MESNTFASIRSSYSFPHVQSWLKSRPLTSVFKGLCGSSDALLCADLFRSSALPVLVATESPKRAEQLVEECRSLLSEDEVLFFPSRDAVPYNFKSPFGPTVENRLGVLHQLLDGSRKIIVAPAAALLQELPPQRELYRKIIRLHCNDEVPIDELSRWLVDNGFHRENQVTDIGMFSIRGGIVDIYPFLSEHPLRIEFWGNSIDSIRQFDVFSQKSLDHTNSAMITPIREFCFSASQISGACATIEQETENGTVDPGGSAKLLHQWKTGDFEGCEWYLHHFPQKVVSLFDYLSSDTIVVWDDESPVENRMDEVRQNYLRHFVRAPAQFQPLLSTPEQLLFSNDAIREMLDCFHTLYIASVTPVENAEVYTVSLQEQPRITPEIEVISRHLTALLENEYRCILICPNEGHVQRMKELLDPYSPEIEFTIGYLTNGFTDPGQKTVFYSESRLLAQPAARTARPKKKSSGAPIAGYDALSPNDYVVHDDHGIACFLGIEQIQAGDVTQDCMVLLYDGGTKIYVPVYDFYKVQKYIGKDAHHPVLSKIGTGSWEKLKTKTRESLREMASELIALYAKRQYLEGIAIDKDTVWQKEFEDAFMYEETPDQLKAVREIKQDMESSRPMDRLVCGDVGFGKTEVAMQAAFKAVMSGYQVAVLAPTTILAAQHFSTFSTRMNNFPVKIASLSRFVKSAQQKEIIGRTALGEVDILIGTHRILSGDISFKNLGLLIIDEEQRFGVHHKEKIKKFRFSIDVLSLSATPIPRTLHLSLIGARDLSIINTPPQNRLPIETVVAPYHEEIVKSAIENELERGGQVYYVNNRIKSLQQTKDTIEQIVPQARVVTAHGQMDEESLERIMKEFIAGRFDVLLSTVIIENGLDIPNVNTIIVNRADMMGLSQLYQLRGRVGRSSEQAFAYFFTPSFKEMTDIALQRLKALEQYTELGSGFQIAMRDLEIRGAGNILGTMQHGYIEAIGFELYCRILKEAIDEIKGTAPAPKPGETHCEFVLPAFITTEYIPDGPTRVSVYQELSAVETLPALSSLQQSVTDRFGPMPQEVASLFIIMKIKVLASSLGISKVAISGTGQCSFYLKSSGDDIKPVIERFMQDTRYAFEIALSEPISFSSILKSSSSVEYSLEVAGMLERVVEKSP
jgi:transcription-repair coupling factor (superfamily II helicase)